MVGQTHARTLGTQLRNRYIEKLRFLKDDYDPSTLYVRSTDFARTVSSAQLVLDGLFAGRANNFDVHVFARNEETLSANWRRCPALHQFYSRALEHLAQAQSIDPAMQRVAFKIGVLPRELEVVGLLDLISSRTAHGMV